ncbi:unnamed protein product [Ostreobium quekettii]|uniref:Ionotropic glutamate receptor C-terminal domain-containing protein n=1 Tax=Ostreobium quekettii TaxID=121088 RepID=A0A8S1J7P0_9CHLO|nr:unnamed protein product [Ostreobium quekettii]
MGRGLYDSCTIKLFLWATLAACIPHTSVIAQGNSSPFNICISTLVPIVRCKASEPQSRYTGYHIDLVADLTKRLGFDNYTLDCRDFKSILEDLQKDNENETTCDMVASGITRSTDRQEAGIKFTYPTYRASLGIMTLAKVREGSSWGFLRPLHWSVWVATIATALVIPWLVFVVESLACHGFIHKGDWLQGLKDATYDSFAALVNFGHYEVHSTAARVVVMAYGFLVLIIVNTYVANLAAFLTITQVDTLVKGVGDLADLPGRRVVSIQVYRDRLARQGILPVIAEQNQDYQAKMVEDLRAGVFRAVVMDEPWVSFTSNTEGCDLKKLSQTIEPFDYAFAFPKTANDSFVQLVSTQVLALQEEGVMETLAIEHINIPRSGCAEDSDISETRAVHFDQVLGLWIILAVAVGGAAFLLVLRINVKRNPRAANVREGTDVNGSVRLAFRMNTLRRKPTMYHRNATEDLQSKSGHTVIDRGLKAEISAFRADLNAMKMEMLQIMASRKVNGGLEHLPDSVVDMD